MAHWDADKLVIESSREFQVPSSAAEVWTLSADGKTLTVATHVTCPTASSM
jgi:hypothetical protein